jgi:hypothetical protein
VPIIGGENVLVDPEDERHVVGARIWRRTTHGGGRTGPDYVNHRSGTRLHRIIMDCPANMTVDHINGNTMDNRRSNLRLATQSQNQMNRGSCRGSSSRYKGVSHHKLTDKFTAQIRVDGKKRHLGLFVSEEEAARAYDVAAIEAFGEFARPNLPH